MRRFSLSTFHETLKIQQQYVFNVLLPTLDGLGAYGPTAKACVDQTLGTLFAHVLSCEHEQIATHVAQLNAALLRTSDGLSRLDTSFKEVKRGASFVKSFAISNESDLTRLT